jgi:hypothetical protein
MANTEHIVNRWSLRVPGTCVYGDADMHNHNLRPVPWNPGWFIKTSSGCSIMIEDVDGGKAYMSICYPHNVCTDIIVIFPPNVKLDEIIGYNLELDKNTLAFGNKKNAYYTNLSRPSYYDYHEFIKFM